MPRPAIESSNSFLRIGILAFASFVLCLSSPMGDATESDQQNVDSRQVYTKSSPNWLSAVGKLRVPGSKFQAGQRSQHREDCSASLVIGNGNSAPDTIITAWHCLEFYTDLSKRIFFTLLPDSDEPILSEVYRLADGGGMYADWAILRLYKPIVATGIYPLKIHPDRPNSGSNIIMAGYSSDPDLGKSGQILTYDTHCRITRQETHDSDSNCRAHRGASGGAVVQLSGQGEAWLSGIISRGDGAGVSTFVPVDGFRSAIRHYVK